MCAALLSLGEGEPGGGGMTELQGGVVGEEDRVREESASSIHTVTHTNTHIHPYTHMHVRRLPCCTLFLGNCGLILNQLPTNLRHDQVSEQL